MDGSISVKTGLVLQVNDAGETITIPVEDANLISKFFELITFLEEIAKTDSESGKSPLQEQIDLHIQRMESIKNKIDEVFGFETCRKVFGDITPSPFAIYDFMDQITPIISKYANERQKKIGNRYIKRRKRHH